LKGILGSFWISIERAGPPQGALYLPSSDPKGAQNAFQGPRTNQVPKMR